MHSALHTSNSGLYQKQNEYQKNTSSPNILFNTHIRVVSCAFFFVSFFSFSFFATKLSWQRICKQQTSGNENILKLKQRETLPYKNNCIIFLDSGGIQCLICRLVGNLFWVWPCGCTMCNQPCLLTIGLVHIFHVPHVYRQFISVKRFFWTSV